MLASGGGLAVAEGEDVMLLPLPIAGLMCAGSAPEVAAQYDQLNKKARTLGCRLEAGFMALSFLALPVIPQLKLSDCGLVDVGDFKLTSLFAD